MDLKLLNLMIIYTITLVHQLESKMKDIQISFKKEKIVPFEEKKTQ